MASVGSLNLNFETNVATLINDMRRASNSVKASSDRMNRSLKTAGSALRGLAVGFAAGFSVRAVAGAADEMKLLKARIQQSTRSLDEFKAAYAGLASQASSITGDLSAGVEIFQRLSFSRDEIRASVDEMLQFTGTVQKLGVVSGASTVALKSGLLQLGQALSSDITRAEEFNSIMENIPVVGKAIADEFGVTTGKLRGLVLEGEVLSKDVFAAILNQTERANEQFAQMPLTISRASQQLGLQFKLLVSGVDEVTNSASILAYVINGMSEALKGVLLVVKTIGFLMERLSTGIAAVFLELFNKIRVALADIIRLVNRIPKVNIPIPDKIEFEGADFGAEGDILFKQQYDEYLASIQKIFPAQTAQSISTRELSKDYQNLAVSIDDTGKKGMVAAQKVTAAQKRVAEEAKETQRQFQNLGKTFQDTFIDFATGATSAREALRGLLLDIQRTLLTNATGGSGGGVFASLFSGLGSVSNTAKFSSRGFGEILGASLKGAYGPGFARGGIATSPSIFGEAGAEAAVPLPDGRSIPVSFSGKGGGGDTYYIDAKGADQNAIARLERKIQALNGSIEKRSIGAVQGMFNRNPSFLRS